MSVTTILTKIALERLGYMVPIARLQTEILPKMEALAERSGYGSLSLFLQALSQVRDTHPHFVSFVDILTINETSFFRQQRQLAMIATNAQRMYQQLKRPIRIWCAACSSGEEAYSLLFLLHEKGVPCEIIGTDIHQPSLRIAKRGTGYPKYRTRNMTPTQLQRFVMVQEQTADVRLEFRDQIQFQYHNLIAHPPPRLGRLSQKQAWDLIVCRNVFIYFSAEQVCTVVRQMQGVLSEQGEIWLGVNDTVQGYQSFLERKSQTGFKYFVSRLADKTKESFIAKEKDVQSKDTVWQSVSGAIQREAWQEAEQLLETLYRHPQSDKGRVLTVQGLLRLRQHDFSQAQRQLRKASIHARREPSIPYFLGVIAHKQRQGTIAKTHFTESIQRDVQFWPAQFLLGQYAYKERQHTVCAAHLSQAKNRLHHPMSSFFQSIYPHLVESVHNNPKDVELLIEHYLSQLE